LLSANLYKNKKPLGQEYLIKEVAGVKIGLVGIVSPIYFNSEFLAKEKFEVKEPEKTLKKILPTVKSQASLIILLSHLGKKETALLLQKVAGIDVAIVGHERGTLNRPELCNNTILVQNNMQGKFLGVLDLTIGEKGTIENFAGSLVGINQEIPLDSEVETLMRDFEKKKPQDRPDTKEKLPQ
jgi:2',3'-cyclic-nucleotide 2'-phosphodiesterase (5'-nucleotidase family)